MANSKPTIFFLPGGFHSPWVFDSVRSILSDRGIATDAAAFPSIGTTDPRVGMLDDAKHLRSLLTKAIDEEGKEVVLVAHSYAGVASANAVEGLGVHQRKARGERGGVLMILYLAASVIPAGTSFAELLDPNNLPWDVSEDGFVKPNNAIHRYYADVEPALANRAVEALKSMPMQVLLDKSTYEPWKQGFEVGYVFTEDDNSLPLGLQKAIWAQFPEGSFAASLASGHSPFLNVPRDLADAIEKGIDNVVGTKPSA
ncbi:hypothetical protein SAMD00023353_5200180 [Rosellinia necatrix]|uniref:AB hydrolase-1 domain-containing protein n=1 Tax=Rosellinia necatrix TaxID=77044 RepID=A0A1W2TQG9_ROSNE|nr:hypothetical protein SAMD00023353_5200180 [Rosellinia necatrix]